MSPPPKDPKRPALNERTMMIETPAFTKKGKAWRPFKFQNLEKVTRTQALLARRLEWMMPGISSTGQVSESVKKRLSEMLDEQVVSLHVEYTHVVAPKNLRRYVGEPTFLAVLAPQPNKTRGFLEVELGLAHAAIDMLLGGAGEAVSLRPLTDIEEGVMTYVILETLKAIAPGLDPSLPRLRLEGVCRGFDEAAELLGDEALLAVVQLKTTFGPHHGYVRIFIPASVLATANPPADAAVRKQKRAADAAAHLGRLKSVRTWLRAEIGAVEIHSSELTELRERDVILVDQLSARPDKGEGGTAKLKIGFGRVGHCDATISVEGGRFKAKITAITTGDSTPELPHQPAEEEGTENGPLTESLAVGDGPEESTNPGIEPKGKRVDETMKSQDGAELLNDIPLQIAVELARVPISAEQVVGLKVGHVIDLNRVPGEPIDLSVNGRIVARGELVEVDGNLGVRVLSLAG